MMFSDNNERRRAAKWLIGVIAACILIYLGVRHINVVADAVSWLVNLFSPLLLGFVMALILNVPMRSLERHLFRKSRQTWMRRLRRPLALILALALVLGIFTGVVVLVIPELISAVKLIGQNIIDGVDRMMQLESSGDFSQLPFGQTLAEVDWLQIKSGLEEWLKNKSGILVNTAVGTIGSLIGGVTNFFIGFIFCLYILFNKETLKRQVCRLIRVWLPRKLGEGVIHVSAVCSQTFSHFVAGQTTEAIILGTLCATGMLILRIPYAPMIGALVGVTALIPIVGAFIGTVVGALMILTTNPIKAVVFVVFLLVLQQIEGNLIYPKVVGSKMNLPAMWVLAAITIGGSLAGPLGMLLGVPAASAAYSLLREATGKRETAMAAKRPVCGNTNDRDRTEEPSASDCTDCHEQDEKRDDVQ